MKALKRIESIIFIVTCYIYLIFNYINITNNEIYYFRRLTTDLSIDIPETKLPSIIQFANLVQLLLFIFVFLFLIVSFNCHDCSDVYS
jgi:hypothetical protein